MSDTAGDPLYETMSLVRIAEMNPEGRARLEYRARADMCHSGGVVQGGFVTGWIDAAMAHAAIARNGADVTPMTLELKVSFFAPVRPGLVIAEGWAVRNGRKTAFYEGHLLDEDGNVLAKASTTMMLADRSRVEAASKAAVTG
ncbi:MAG TPA: PaaI family thioesterase [Novosphingobium sp.]|nr:PaaI family thioesterase [Novosphingobium sp.]HPZ46611.1 PaaI family thioesterase [Novosphingobium sp.]HQD98902.1 PaaI family thioesterase [Novosphingobium sp.]HQQ09017.1 PaaI family thioesterase [Novosphingobium sp.]